MHTGGISMVPLNNQVVSESMSSLHEYMVLRL